MSRGMKNYKKETFLSLWLSFISQSVEIEKRRKKKAENVYEANEINRQEKRTENGTL